MATKDVTDRMVCGAYAEFDKNRMKATDDHGFPYHILMERTGEPFKVCWRAMERACDRDLIEYGVSLRTGWLTDKGRALLTTRQPQKGET